MMIGRVLITGVAGFLGSHLADSFLKAGWEVVGVDNLIGGDKENVPEGVLFYEFDTASCLSPLYNGVFEGVDVVYHCACSPHEGLSVFSPVHISENTFGNTTPVITAAIQHGVRRFVYCSSMSRYGSQETPFCEFMVPKPQDPYAIAKVASETMLRVLGDSHGMEWVVAVPHNIIGVRQKYDDPYRNVASIMLNRVLSGKPPVVYGDGSQVRCFSFVEDVVDTLVLLATDPRAHGEIFNVGGDENPVSILELAYLVMEVCGVEGWHPVFFPDRPQEVKVATTSSDKIRATFGFKSKQTLSGQLELMRDDILRKGVKPFRYHKELEIVTEGTPLTWKEELI